MPQPDMLSLDETGRRQWWRARTRDGWPLVRITYAEVRPCPGGRRVRAAVHLGHLAPVDVIVELRPAPPRSSDPRLVRRMWSAESLDNGTVIFEVHLNAARAAPAEPWLLCVRPAEAVRGRPVLYPIFLAPA